MYLKSGNFLLGLLKANLGLVVLSCSPLQIQRQTVTFSRSLVLLLTNCPQLSLTFVKPLPTHFQVVSSSLVVLLQLDFHVLGLGQFHVGLVVHLLQGGELLQHLLAVIFVLVGD